MKTTVHALILIGLVALLAAPLYGSPSLPARAQTGEVQTAILRRGYLGYNGVSDTYMQNGATTPFGASQQLDLKETAAWGGRRILMRFEMPDTIPANAEISRAELRLYPYYLPTPPITFQCYYLKKAWSESTATWTTTGMTEDWLVAGANGPDTDYESNYFAAATVSAIAQHVTIDMRPAVRRWLHNPDENHGILIIASTTNYQVNFRSSEVVRTDEQPVLTIDYTMPEATFTPTATASPTVTATPSITATPPSTATPPPGATLTHTPTQGPTATPTFDLGPSPTPVAVVYSFGPTEAQLQSASNDNRLCITVSPGETKSLEMLLVWEGQPSYARLRVRHANNNALFPVTLNGHVVGNLPTINYSASCSGGTEAFFDIDPAWLINGVNEVSISGDPRDSYWSIQDPRIELRGTLYVPKVNLQTYIGADTMEQRVIVQQPASYLPGTAVPLVIACHGRGGRDFDALVWNGLAAAANQRGWLLACPDLRSDPSKQVIYTPSLGIQADVQNMIATLKERYTIDPSRIYIMGMSQGGMFAGTLAAKAPDVFAAMAELKGPTSLSGWYGELSAYWKSVLEAELGGSPSTALFSYQRRSVAEMTPNLRHVPTLIIHGLTDVTVPFHHAQDLKTSLDNLDPHASYEPLLYAYDGGHFDDHPDWPTARILEWFSGHTLVSNPDLITVRTDEPKTYYWLGLSYINSWAPLRWTNLRAARDPLTQAITLDITDERQLPSIVTVDLLKAGLPSGVEYVLEDTNLSTGDYAQTIVSPQGDKIKVNVTGEPHHLTLYPMTGAPPTLQTAHVTVTDDTYIDGYAPDAFLNNGPLWLTRSGVRTALLRFTLGLPENAVVKGAQLRLYASYKEPTSGNLNTTVHGVLQDWQPSQTNWRQWRTGLGWEVEGALGADSDYVSGASSNALIDAMYTWYTYNVTQLVQQWFAVPSSNNGLLVRAGAGTASKVRINSKEDGSNRPEIVVYWAEATATPTPTATPTSTATPTPQHRLCLPAILRGPS